MTTDLKASGASVFLGGTTLEPAIIYNVSDSDYLRLAFAPSLAMTFLWQGNVPRSHTLPSGRARTQAKTAEGGLDLDWARGVMQQ